MPPFTELAAPHDVSKQAVAKHVQILVDAGLVEPLRATPIASPLTWKPRCST